jgi:hypothetical protein
MEKNRAFLQRVCPLCHKPASNVEVASRKRAEAMAFDALAPYWNGFFKERIFFSYSRCANCDLLFAPFFLTGEQLGELYSQMPPNMDIVPPGVLRATQRGYFELLRDYARLDGGYLELGADVGLFTENCVAEGAFEHYWLFEPNRDVAPALGQVMQGKPHSIIHDMFDFSQAPDGTVGVAAMIHVLDHLLDPLETLKAIQRKLRPGGAVLIVTHDESSLLRRIFRTNWPPFCLQHPQLYSPKSIRKLLTEAGFRNVQVRKTANHFPIRFLVQQFLWACGLKVDRVPAFGGATVGLKLGNMMTLATA